MRLGFLALVALLASPATVHSQECNAVLDGMYDFETTNFSRFHTYSFRDWFCANHSLDAGGNVSLPIDGLPVAAAFDLSEASESCGRTQVDQETRESFNRILRTVNQGVVRAWERCMASPGFQVGVRLTEEPTRFLIVMRYVRNGNLPHVKIENGTDGIDISSNAEVSCRGDWINSEDRTVPVQRVVSCTRDDAAQSVTVVVNSDPAANFGSGFAQLPGYRPPTEAVSRPTCQIRAVATRGSGCGAGSTYVGPHNPGEHGGYCVDFNGCDFSAQSVRTNTCSNGVYLGPHNAREHGGFCVELRDDRFSISTEGIRSTSCPQGSTYVGPHNPREHGGYCLRLTRS